MPSLRRVLLGAALGLAAFGLSLGSTAAPAAAATYQPSPADFADCPARPANATGAWTCYVATATGGYVRLDKMSANLSAPWRLTVAQGTVGGVPVAKLGALRADPVPFVSGLPGTPFVIPSPTGWKLQPFATGQVTPGLLRPSALGIKFQIIGDNLGGSCFVGTDSAPVVLKPKTSYWLPWLFGLTPMWKVQVYDDVYSLPASNGCGNSLVVNTLLGVPANATSNYIQIQWAFRTKKS